MVTSTIKHRRKSLKKRVINRKKASYEKRKLYFEGLTKKAADAQKASKKSQAVKGKKNQKGKQQKGSAKKGSAKKGSAKKGSAKKGNQNKKRSKK